MNSDVTLRASLVMVVMAAILPLFGLAGLGAMLTVEETQSRTEKNLELSASLVATNQNNYAASAQQLLTSISQVPDIANTPQPQCQRYFKSLVEQLAGYANIGIIGADGGMLCDALNTRAGVYAGDRSYFQEVMATRKFAVSGYLVGRISNRPMLVFATPLATPDGKPAAVVFASMYLSEITKLVASAPLEQGNQLIVADRFGTVLAVNPDQPDAVGKPVASPTLRNAMLQQGRGAGRANDFGDDARIYAFTSSSTETNSAFFVAVSSNVLALNAPAERRLMFALLSLAGVTLLGSLLAWRLGNRAIVKPVNTILRAAAELEQGRLDVRIPVEPRSTHSELTKLAIGFNAMAQALERRVSVSMAELAQTRQTERKLRDAQRLGRIGNFEYNLSTQLVSWSDEVYEFFGLTLGSFDGRRESLVQLIVPEDRVRYQNARDKAVSSQSELDIEYRINTPSGVRWLHQRGSPVFDEKGVIVSRTGVVQEITERKRAELAISRHNELMARTGEMAKIGGWELLLDRQVLVCSDQVYRIYGVQPAGYTPLAVAMGFYAPESRSQIMNAIEACIEHGKPWDQIFSLVTAAGLTLKVRVQGKAIQEGGRTTRIVGAMQDVTEGQQAYAQLALLQSAVSRLNDIVLIAEVPPGDLLAAKIVFVNDAFERQTGYQSADALGKPLWWLQGPNTDQAELARINAALRKQQAVRSELINYTKDGAEIWLEIDIVPLKNAEAIVTHFVAVERDVTSRKHAEQALIDSEQRYTALFTTAPVPMWVFDFETTKFLTVNQAAINSYGYSHDEFLSMSVFDIRTEEQGEAWSQLRAPQLADNRLRWTHKRKNGTTFQVQVFSEPVKYGGRESCFVLALDVSAQAKAEAEVQEHLYTLQRAADAAQAITWHQTLGGTMKEVVEQARGVIGAHQAVVSLNTSNGTAQVIHAVSMSQKYEAYASFDAPSDGTGIYAMVSENARSIRMTQAQLEAHPRWRGFGRHAAKHPPMRGWLAVPLTGRSGKGIGVLQLTDKYEGEFTPQDEYVAIEMAQLASSAIENAQLIEEVNQLNTGLEQKVAERTAALTRQEALFRTLAEQAPQVVWTADPGGKITFLNQAWIDLAGGVLSDWVGNQWIRAIHPEDLPGVQASWHAAVANQTPYVGIRRVLAQDGSYHTMSYRASPVYDDQNDIVFWVGIDADITEIKLIEDALRLSNQELEAFSYSVSHDLRSPLNTVDGFSRLLGKRIAGTLDEKGAHYLSRIQAGVAQMGQLIEDLLSLAQVARAQLRMEPVDLSAIAHSILGERHAASPDRVVKIQIQEGLQANGDSRLLYVVLENLLGNAWKFTARTPVAEITVGQIDDALGQPQFFVRDNGAGFDMAYADKLFTAFQRLHTVSEFPGTGIGLATVSRVIVRHGGKLWAQAAPGQGATFYFTLPRQPG